MVKNKLAIFDLDGTLFDTSEVNFWAYRDALSQFGFELDRNWFANNCNGRHYTEFLPQIMGGTQNIDEVHGLKKEAYRKYLGKARENKHLFNIINRIREDYYIAIVTTASRKNTTEILERFGRLELFDYLVTQEDVTKVKPDPQGFLMAMEHFGLTPKETMIFEDSDVGTEAAQNAGATVFKCFFDNI